VQREKRSLPVVNITGGQHLLDALFKLGPVRSGDMGGRSTVDWRELHAFGQATGRLSEPWEYELLMEMASAYLEGNNLGRDPLSYSPVEMVSQ